MATQLSLQDLPPKGGYSSINYRRIPARSYFKGWHFFVGLIALKVFGFYVYRHNKYKLKYVQVENRSSRFAILPLMVAERDRGLLKQVRFNREEEEKLMKDVPDWEVGKYFKEPVYKTIDPDTWMDPLGFEFFAHSDINLYVDRIHYNWYHI